MAATGSGTATSFGTSFGAYKALLAVGVTASSFFVFGNVASSRYGILGLISDEQRKSVQIDVRKSVQLFAWFYEHAAPWKVAMSASTFISLVAAARQPAAGAKIFARIGGSRVITTRQALYAAGIGMISIVPWTALVMLPNNKALQAHRTRVYKENERAGSSETVAAATSDAENNRDILDRLERWHWHHLYRLTVGSLAFVTSLVAALDA